MPRKTDATKNRPLTTSLPTGAMALLQELVDLQEVGGDRSDVIRHLIVIGLQTYVDRGRIGRKRAPDAPQS